MLTGVIAGIFLLRILIYSYGYTKAQIGGAEVSRNIRLFMGDHLKRIPLSRFTQGQTGDYINTITSDVNNYEKILTHKIGDLAKSFALSIMLIVFVMTVYVPAGLILLAADLLLIPGLWLSFRMVRKYGQEKNDICAENVSSIVEYVSGIQTFRAYGVGGLKNRTVIDAMRAFCRISYVYEAKVLPVGAGLSILTWLACPLVIWAAYAPWAAGTLDTVSYLLICMLPLFCAKLANTIFVDLTSYKNLMISKSKILGVMEEPEESGSMEPFQTDTHEITFDHVDFAYVPGEPVLKQATFTVPDQKLTAIVGDSGSGKSTILNLIAKYYEPSGGAISIGGRPTGRVAAERVLEQISMAAPYPSAAGPRAVWRRSGCWSRSPWWIRMCSSLMTPSGTISATHALMPPMGKSRRLAGRPTATALSAAWRRAMIPPQGRMAICSPAVSASASPLPGPF